MEMYRPGERGAAGMINFYFHLKDRSAVNQYESAQLFDLTYHENILFAEIIKSMHCNNTRDEWDSYSYER